MFRQVGFKIDAEGRIIRYVDPPVTENFVFEGGGPLGVGYKHVWSTIERLQREDKLAGRKPRFDPKRVGGSSAGSCYSLLVGLGMSGAEIEDFTDRFDLSALRDKDTQWMEQIKRANPSLTGSALEEKFMQAAGEKTLRPAGAPEVKHPDGSKFDKHKGNVLLYSLQDIIRKQIKAKLDAHIATLDDEAKNNFINFLKKNDIAKEAKGSDIELELPITFRKLHKLVEGDPKVKGCSTTELGFKDLYVTGVNATLKTSEVFRHDNEEYADMDIALAVRISMSIPRFFDTVQYKGFEWMDGGVLNNFPIQIFNTARDEPEEVKKQQPKSPNGSAPSPKQKKEAEKTFRGVYGQNLATLGFKLDDRRESFEFWYKPGQRVKKRVDPNLSGFRKFTSAIGEGWRTFKFNLGYYFTNYIWYPIKYYAVKKAMTKGINVGPVFKKEFSIAKNQYAQQTIQIPTYNTRIDDVKSGEEKMPARLVQRIKQQNARFNLFNFDLNAREKKILSENGRKVTEEYFDHHRNQKLEIEVKRYDYSNTDPNEETRVRAVLKQMPDKELREFYYFLRSNVDSTSIFKELDEEQANAKRALYIDVIKKIVAGWVLTNRLPATEEKKAEPVRKVTARSRLSEPHYPPSFVEGLSHIQPKQSVPALHVNMVDDLSPVAASYQAWVSPKREPVQPKTLSVWDKIHQTRRRFEASRLAPKPDLFTHTKPPQRVPLLGHH